MNVTFIQTSDPFHYYPMLQETAKTLRRYCQINGFGYEQYVGIKRGHMLWQAAFNRAYMLKEMLDRGVEGWVFYLDADAFLTDMRFDLVGYLADKARYGAIFAGHISEAYDVNSGGFAVNLSHPAGKALVLDYHRRCEEKVTDAYFRAISWEHDVYNDQYILYLLLKDWFDLGFGDQFLIEHTNHSYVNNGPFISQQLRTFFPTFEARYDAIRQRVAQIMGDAPHVHPYRTAGTWLPAAHPRLTTDCGNKTGVGLFTTGEGGVFLRGPNIRLEAGSHILRIYGRTSSGMPSSRVTAEAGNAMLSATARERTSSTDVLIEHHFSIVTPMDDVSVEMDVTPDHHVCIHGVQIVAGQPAQAGLLRPPAPGSTARDMLSAQIAGDRSGPSNLLRS